MSSERPLEENSDKQLKGLGRKRILQFFYSLLLVGLAGCFAIGYSHYQQELLWAEYWFAAIDANQRQQHSWADYYYKAALEQAEKIFTPHDIRLANTHFALGKMYFNRKRRAEAIPHYLQAIESWEHFWGRPLPARTEIIRAHNNVALFYRIEGEYAKAEPYYEQTLHLREKAMGPVHRKVADNLNDLAYVYSRQEKLEEARSLYRPLLVQLDRYDEAKLLRDTIDSLLDTNIEAH